MAEDDEKLGSRVQKIFVCTYFFCTNAKIHAEIKVDLRIFCIRDISLFVITAVYFKTAETLWAGSVFLGKLIWR